MTAQTEDVLDPELVDRVMRQMRDTWGGRREPMTDAEWERVKLRFKASTAVLRQRAVQSILDGEWDD